MEDDIFVGDTKNKKRAERRHHYYRLRNKRKNYWISSSAKDDRMLGILVSTPKPCSRPVCCGNKRQVYGPTFQELKNIYNEHEYYDTYDDYYDMYDVWNESFFQEEDDWEKYID